MILACQTRRALLFVGLRTSRRAEKLSIASAIAGPSTTPGAEPSWAAGRGAVQVVVGAGGTAAVQLRLPAMAFEYYLIKAG